MTKRFGWLGIAVLTAWTGCTPPTSEPAPVPWDGPGAHPSRWFYGQRASKGAVPVRARSRALEAAKARGAVTAPGTWENVGPYNIGGRVTAIARDPNVPSRLWIGTAAGGVFRSEDGGVNWEPVFDDQVALSIGSVVAHPSLSDVVYVGTGEDNGGGLSYDGEGVFRSTDGGETWTSLGLAEVRRIGKMAIDPVDPDRIFVAAGGDWFHKDTHRGIYRSVNGGLFWEQVLLAATDAGGTDIVIDPTNPDRIYASLWQRFSFGDDWYIGGASGGVFRSLDGGDTWTKLTNGLPATPGRIGLAIAPSDPQVVYASVISPAGTLDGIYRSPDGGNTWFKRSDATTTQQFTPYSYYFSQIRVSPTNSSTIFALDQRLHQSINAGLSFSPIAASVHVDWHDLILGADGTMLAGTDGGFFRSEDNGANWFKSTTLPITQFYDLGIDPQDTDRRFAGAQDNGTVRTVTGDANDWAGVLGGDGLQCEVDYTDSSRVYASAQYGFLARSVDGGQSFFGAVTGIGVEPTNWNAPYVLDPIVPTTLYTATFRVYRSVDSAVSWQPISGDLTDGALTADGHDHDNEGDESRRDHKAQAVTPGADHLENLVNHTVTVVHVSEADRQVVWAGTDDGNVWVTPDGGLQWNRVDPPGPGYWVTDIAAHPFDPQTAWVSVTGYRGGDDLPYIRVTRDRGATWEDVTGDLPQVPVNTLVVDREFPGRLYAGTDLGVYYSDDGAGWHDMRGGMPYVVVMDLVRHPGSDTLWAASHSRGIYRFDLRLLPAPDSDGDGADDRVDCAPDDPAVLAVPGDVGPLLLRHTTGEPTIVVWPGQAATAGTDTVYDVAYGSLANLRDPGTIASTSLACGISEPGVDDPTDPRRGNGTWYLVRARNPCGNGPWGADGTGTERQVRLCAE